MRKLKKILPLRLVRLGDVKRQTNGGPFGAKPEIDQVLRYDD
ncbi:hypothetical protein [Phenylobacterium deserti]|nr:hypothetical protein [Phenylobacterium deserti]